MGLALVIAPFLLGAVGVTVSRALSAPGASPEHGRFPAPAPQAPATVWAVGDGAIGSDAARAVAAMISDDDPAAFLLPGATTAATARFRSRSSPGGRASPSWESTGGPCAREA